MSRRFKVTLLSGVLAVVASYSLIAWAYPYPDDGTQVRVIYYTDNTYTTVKGLWIYGSCGRHRSGDTTGVYTDVEIYRCPNPL